MMDQVADYNLVEVEVLKAVRDPRPAAMGPLTEECMVWLLSGVGPTFDARANVVVAGMTGGHIAPWTLGSRIRSVAETASFDAANLTETATAVDDAALFADKFIPNARPNVSLTSEGTVLLTWERGPEGTALLFVGDGTVVYSKSDADFSYPDSGIEQPINQQPPADYRFRLNQGA